MDKIREDLIHLSMDHPPKPDTVLIHEDVFRCMSRLAGLNIGRHHRAASARGRKRILKRASPMRRMFRLE